MADPLTRGGASAIFLQLENVLPKIAAGKILQ